jgi:hypothetical protein
MGLACALFGFFVSVYQHQPSPMTGKKHSVTMGLEPFVTMVLS